MISRRITPHQSPQLDGGTLWSHHPRTVAVLLPGRTTSTEQAACAATVEDTLPCRKCFMPWRSLVPTKSASAPHFSTSSRRTRPGLPSLVTFDVLKPAARNLSVGTVACAGIAVPRAVTNGRLTVLSRRLSAGTLSPARRMITSLGTSSRAGISTSSPSGSPRLLPMPPYVKIRFSAPSNPCSSGSIRSNSPLSSQMP